MDNLNNGEESFESSVSSTETCTRPAGKQKTRFIIPEKKHRTNYGWDETHHETKPKYMASRPECPIMVCTATPLPESSCGCEGTDKREPFTGTPASNPMIRAGDIDSSRLRDKNIFHQYTWSSDELCFSDLPVSSSGDGIVSPATFTRSLKSDDVKNTDGLGVPSLPGTALGLKITDEEGTSYIIITPLHDGASAGQKLVVGHNE